MQKKQHQKWKQTRKKCGDIKSLAFAKREIILILSAQTKYRLHYAFYIYLSLSLSCCPCACVCLQKSMPDIVNMIRHLNAKDTLHNDSQFSVRVCMPLLNQND